MHTAPKHTYIILCQAQRCLLLVPATGRGIPQKVAPRVLIACNTGTVCSLLFPC